MYKAVKHKLEASGVSSSKESDDAEQQEPNGIRQEQESNEIKKEQESNEIKQEPEEKGLEKTESEQLKSSKQSGKPENAMKILRAKPNYFLAVQVNDMVIKNEVKKLQEKIISQTPALKPALVNISTLHVTLAVTHLASQSDVETVKKKLDEWAAQNIKNYFDSPLILSFKGVQIFNSGVAYVDLEQTPNYKKFIDLSVDMNNLLSSAGYFTESKKGIPHLTVLKLSKDYKLVKKKQLFKSDLELLTNSDEFFGKQEIHDLQLLSMKDPKDEDGYYKCLHKIKVSAAQ